MKLLYGLVLICVLELLLVFGVTTIFVSLTKQTKCPLETLDINLENAGTTKQFTDKCISSGLTYEN